MVDKAWHPLTVLLHFSPVHHSDHSRHTPAPGLCSCVLHLQCYPGLLSHLLRVGSPFCPCWAFVRGTHLQPDILQTYRCLPHKNMGSCREGICFLYLGIPVVSPAVGTPQWAPSTERLNVLASYMTKPGELFWKDALLS